MNHKELDAWKKSIELVETVYAFTKKFPKEELFCMVQQMRRCAVSVPSNIAEGCARKSDAETIQFLYIAAGSLAELETQLIISEKIGYGNTTHMIEQIAVIRQLIIGLSRYLKTKKK
ncbi:MAG: four helix bundle protein [Bacteroidales bacterium]|nr:four helix bundle protein [Bacteroidales bacterium]